MNEKKSLAAFLDCLKYQTFLTIKLKHMGNLLYLIAVILIIIWAISFLGGFFTGGIIHILLVIAVIMILLKVLRRERI